MHACSEFAGIDALLVGRKKLLGVEGGATRRRGGVGQRGGAGRGGAGRGAETEAGRSDALWARILIVVARTPNTSVPGVSSEALTKENLWYSEMKEHDERLTSG